MNYEEEDEHDIKTQRKGYKDGEIYIQSNRNTS